MSRSNNTRIAEPNKINSPSNLVLVFSTDQYMMHWNLNMIYVSTQLCIGTCGSKFLLGPCRWLTYTLKHEILLSLNHNLDLQHCKFSVNSHKMIHSICKFRLSVCLSNSKQPEFSKSMPHLVGGKKVQLFQSNSSLIELIKVLLSAG